jgi:hypothetical protein
MRRCAGVLALVVGVLGALSGCESLWVERTLTLRYQADPILAPLGLEVTAEAGEVFIAGAAQSELQREHAVKVAQQTSGVAAAYFVEVDRPDRPVTFERFRAGAAQTWEAAVAAVRAAGWRMQEEAAERSLTTAPRRVRGTWVSLGIATQARLHLQLHPRGESVTVIAVVERLDTADLGWCLDEERRIVRGIGEILATGGVATPR